MLGNSEGMVGVLRKLGAWAPLSLHRMAEPGAQGSKACLRIQQILFYGTTQAWAMSISTGPSQILGATYTSWLCLDPQGPPTMTDYALQSDRMGAMNIFNSMRKKFINVPFLVLQYCGRITFIPVLGGEKKFYLWLLRLCFHSQVKGKDYKTKC